MPTPSSSLASRTSVICGSSSAMRIRWTSQVSGRAERMRMPHFFNAWYTSSEFGWDTGIGESSLQGIRNDGKTHRFLVSSLCFERDDFEREQESSFGNSGDRLWHVYRR